MHFKRNLPTSTMPPLSLPQTALRLAVCSSFCVQTAVFPCRGFHHPVDMSPLSPRVPRHLKHTPAAWEAVSGGAEGRQSEMEYLLQQLEQHFLEGGRALWIPGEWEQRRGKELTFTESLPLSARRSAKCICLLVYLPKDYFKLG